MGIKQILKKAVNILPDRLFLQLEYCRRFGKFPNLKVPKTFNEKLQWLKLYDRKPEYSIMVDKHEVKQYVAERIGEEYVIPTLGVWDRFEDINFDVLPEQFVLKCTHDSGGLVICRDKSKLDMEAARKKITRSLENNYYWHCREWPYKSVKPRILAEAYMEDENAASGLTDYKFFCFNAEPKLMYISQGLEDHATARISFYDVQGNQMPFYRNDYLPMEEGFCFPDNLDRMVEIARSLAKECGCAFVRVDLYSVNGRIYFSELTFSPCSGMIPFEPKKWDERLGEWLEIQTEKA